MTYPLDRAAQLLTELQQHSTFRRGDLGFPTDGSPGATELACLTEEQRRYVNELLSVVLLRLTAAEEFLVVAGQVVAADRLIYSLYPLCRSAAEFSARVAWLLDPEVSAARRMRRSVGDVVESHTELSRLQVPGVKEWAKRRKSEFLAGAANAGLQPEKPPSRTDSLEALWQPEDVGALTFQLLSAFSHGTAYALHQLMFPVRDQSGELVRTAVEGLSYAQVGTHPKQEAQALAMALVPYDHAVRRWMTWSGRIDQIWHGHVRAIMGELRPFVDQDS